MDNLNSSASIRKMVLVGLGIFTILATAELTNSSSQKTDELFIRYESQNSSLGDNQKEYITLDCSSTYIKYSEKLAMLSDNRILVQKLIKCLIADNDEEDYYPSIDFINEQNNQNSENCISIITSAFSYDNFKCAEQLLGSIMLSDLDYLSIWFKELLLKGKNINSISAYANDIYETYREVFDAL